MTQTHDSVAVSASAASIANTQARGQSKDGAVTHFVTILRAHLPELAARYGVKSLAVFGSYIRNEQREDSDLDVLVELDERGLTLLQFVALQNTLSDLLGVKVDLVEKSCLKPLIAPEVLSEALAV